MLKYKIPQIFTLTQGFPLIAYYINRCVYKILVELLVELTRLNHSQTAIV